MSKDRDLIFDMTEDPEVLTYPAADNEPLQLGGVGDDAASAADRQVTTPGDVHVAPQMPAPIDGTLRQFALRVPSVIDECSGIMVFGKRIKSLVFSTDLAIIRNVNADAVFAVYPFTPQPVITQALLMASDLPVFVGVGGGLTTGKRVVNLAMYAEMQGATGVVVNAPTPGRILNRIRSSVDVPVVVTVANADTNYRHRIEDGAAILNVAAGAQTPEIVAEIRERFPDYPILATGGADDESIRATIRAGANAIIWTPPSAQQLQTDMMQRYRKMKEDATPVISRDDVPIIDQVAAAEVSQVENMNPDVPIPDEVIERVASIHDHIEERRANRGLKPSLHGFFFRGKKR